MYLTNTSNPRHVHEFVYFIYVKICLIYVKFVKNKDCAISCLSFLNQKAFIFLIMKLMVLWLPVQRPSSFYLYAPPPWQVLLSNGWSTFVISWKEEKVKGKLFFFLCVLGIEPRTWHIQHKCCEPLSYSPIPKEDNCMSAQSVSSAVFLCVWWNSRDTKLSTWKWTMQWHPASSYYCVATTSTRLYCAVTTQLRTH
jgi:hypothetical protein